MPMRMSLSLRAFPQLNRALVRCPTRVWGLPHLTSVLAIRASLFAKQPGERRLFLDEIPRLAVIGGEVVELLGAVLRRGDELEQRAIVAVEDAVAIGHEVGLVIREALPRWREQRLPLPRLGNR